MAKESYYPEDILVEKMQNGEYGWKDYVLHYSEAWKLEYEKFCRLRDLPQDDDTALRFLEMKQAEMEEALESGDA